MERTALRALAVRAGDKCTCTWNLCRISGPKIDCECAGCVEAPQSNCCDGRVCDCPAGDDREAEALAAYYRTGYP